MKRLLIVFILVGYTCLGCASIPTPRNKPTPLPPDPTRQVVLNSLPFTEQWKWSGPGTVIVINDRVIVATQNDLRYKIVAFDAHTGDFLWESEDIRNLRSLHTDTSRVYIGAITYVQAFDLKTGKTLWTGAEQPVSKKGSLDVYPKGEQLEVYDFDENLLYLLDAQTGQMVEKIERPFIFFHRDAIYYSGGCGYGYNTRCLKATDTNGTTLWSHDFKGTILLWPTFVEDKMFINAGGRLFAVDAEKGDIIWQSNDAVFITSLALGGEALYAIREDATIVGFDPETGEQLGTIEITPKQTRHNVGYIAHYAIAASDKYLAAYYGDSDELIMFEKN